MATSTSKLDPRNETSVRNIHGIRIAITALFLASLSLLLIPALPAHAAKKAEASQSQSR